MRMMFWGAALLGLLVSGQANAQSADVDQIIERFENANQWRDHVMVVAHRAGWKQNGQIRRAENSIAALNHSIASGIEMVEVDVQKTRDGELVVLHDSWLDRTTTCKGRLVERDLTGLAQCRLVIEGTGKATAESVPTLRMMLQAAKGRIMVNIDNKLGLDALPEISALARELGVERQIVLKQNLWSAGKVSEMSDVMAEIGEGIHFMPIIADDAVTDLGFLENVGKSFSANAVELINWRKDGEGMTAPGGQFFNARARAIAARGEWHLWVNTFSIVNMRSGMLSGGRGDELAVLASVPEESWGFWAEQGVTMIQTDEPEAAINWLSANGYRVPYEVAPVDTANIN